MPSATSAITASGSNRCDRRGKNAGPQSDRRAPEQRGNPVLFKKNKITFFHGQGRFEARSPDGYRIAVADAANTVVGRHVIVATGRRAPAAGLAFDETRVLSNDGALAIPQVPRRLA